MFRRLLMAVAAAVALVVPMILVATTPASACVLGCQNGGIVVSPHGGNAGTWTAHLPPTYTQVRVVRVTWRVTNTNDHAVELAVTAGATGCAAKEPPYVSPSSLSLDAEESATVYTYIKYSCIGGGTAWAGAGQDQGSQSITFISP